MVKNAIKIYSNHLSSLSLTFFIRVYSVEIISCSERNKYDFMAVDFLLALLYYYEERI